MKSVDLFLSLSNKKVFLHNFNWQPTSDSYYGEGEFLIRLEFTNRAQWVTHHGKSTIALVKEDSKLLIKPFHFEDNLH